MNKMLLLLLAVTAACATAGTAPGTPAPQRVAAPQHGVRLEVNTVASEARVYWRARDGVARIAFDVNGMRYNDESADAAAGQLTLRLPQDVRTVRAHVRLPGELEDVTPTIAVALATGTQ